MLRIDVATGSFSDVFWAWRFQGKLPIRPRINTRHTWRELRLLINSVSTRRNRLQVREMQHSGRGSPCHTPTPLNVTEPALAHPQNRIWPYTICRVLARTYPVRRLRPRLAGRTFPSCNPQDWP